MEPEQTGAVKIVVVLFIAYLVASVLVLAGIWRILHKAGRPGWLVLVPIYNTWKFMEVAGKPGWWAFLLLVPGVSIVVGIMAMLELAKRFDKDKVFAVLLIIMPYIFLPVLGFGSAKYKQQPLAA